jgi:hypothetical protein
MTPPAMKSIRGFILVPVLLATLAGCQRGGARPAEFRADARADFRRSIRRCGYLRSLEPNMTHAIVVANQGAALEIVVKDSHYLDLIAAASYLLREKEDGLRALVGLVADRRHVGLDGFADLSIPARIELGDMKDDGHGLTLWDDLFIVAGRANWILEEATCRTFGPIDLYTKPTRLKLISALWQKYLDGEPIGVPYETRLAPDRMVSRAGIHDAIAALRLVEERQRQARAAGNKALDRRSALEVELRVSGLRAATGLDYGTDAAAWDEWNIQAEPYLFFDWTRMQMRVAPEAQRTRKPLPDENLLDLPQ